MNEKANIAIDEMSSIKTKLETLKGSSKVMPKGIWHKVARSKIVDITANEFILRNSEGLTYRYKRFEPINIQK